MNTYNIGIELVEASREGEYIQHECVENIKEICCGRRRGRDWYGTIWGRGRTGRELLLTLEMIRGIAKVYRVEVVARLETKSGEVLGWYDIHHFGWVFSRYSQDA